MSGRGGVEERRRDGEEEKRRYFEIFRFRDESPRVTGEALYARNTVRKKNETVSAASL